MFVCALPQWSDRAPAYTLPFVFRLTNDNNREKRKRSFSLSPEFDCQRFLLRPLMAFMAVNTILFCKYIYTETELRFADVQAKLHKCGRSRSFAGLLNLSHKNTARFNLALRPFMAFINTIYSIQGKGLGPAGI